MIRCLAVAPAALPSLYLFAATFATLPPSKVSRYPLEMCSNKSGSRISRHTIPALRSVNCAQPSYPGMMVGQRSCSIHSYSLTWVVNSSCRLPSYSESLIVRTVVNLQASPTSERRLHGSRIGSIYSATLSSTWCTFHSLLRHRYWYLLLYPFNLLHCRWMARLLHPAQLQHLSPNQSQELRRRNGGPQHAANAAKQGTPVKYSMRFHMILTNTQTQCVVSSAPRCVQSKRMTTPRSRQVCLCVRRVIKSWDQGNGRKGVQVLRHPCSQVWHHSFALHVTHHTSRIHTVSASPCPRHGCRAALVHGLRRQGLHCCHLVHRAHQSRRCLSPMDQQHPCSSIAAFPSA